jgi:hypothetical protein
VQCEGRGCTILQILMLRSLTLAMLRCRRCGNNRRRDGLPLWEEGRRFFSQPCQNEKQRRFGRVTCRVTKPLDSRGTCTGVG